MLELLIRGLPYSAGLVARPILIAAICFLHFSGWAVAAGAGGLFRIDNWEGRAYAGEHSNRFDHCAARYTKEGDLTIIYSLDSQYHWGLEFSSGAWNFLRGARFNAALSLGKQERVFRRAVAISPHVLRLELPNSLSLFNGLRDAWQMELVVGGLRIDFKLMDNAQVLRALTRCVVQHQRLSRSANVLGPIVVSGRARKSAGADDRSAVRLESSKLAAKIMAQITMPKSGAAALTNFPAGISADAVWKVGDLLFTVSTLLPGRAPDTDHWAGIIIGHDMNMCSGQMFGGAELDNSKMARILTSCTTSNGTVTVYYVGYPRKGGGFYLLATVARPLEFNAAMERAANEFDRRVRAELPVLLSSR